MIDTLGIRPFPFSGKSSGMLTPTSDRRLRFAGSSLVVMRFHVADDVTRGSITRIAFNDNVFVTNVSDTLGQSLTIDGGLRGGAVVIGF